MISEYPFNYNVALLGVISPPHILDLINEEVKYIMTKIVMKIWLDYL